MKRKEKELKRKLFKVNESLDSILSPMNLDLLLPSLLCFSPQEHPPRMVNLCWSSFVLSCFHFFFLLRWTSPAYRFNIKLQLFKLKLWSPSWSGTLPVSYRSFLTNQTMSKYCDLNYRRRIRPFSSLGCEIEKFWFGPQSCQKLDSLLDCKNNLLFQL